MSKEHNKEKCKELQNGPQFEIRTLADIFNLPTEDQMDRCLQELGAVMKQMRELRNIARNLLHKNILALCPVEWPEVATWVDDGRGEITHTIKDAGGKPVGSVTNPLFLDTTKKEMPTITPEELGGVLSGAGLVDAGAIESPESYDSGQTELQILMATNKLNDLIETQMQEIANRREETK